MEVVPLFGEPALKVHLWADWQLWHVCIISHWLYNMLLYVSQYHVLMSALEGVLAKCLKSRQYCWSINAVMCVCVCNLWWLVWILSSALTNEVMNHGLKFQELFQLAQCIQVRELFVNCHTIFVRCIMNTACHVSSRTGWCNCFCMLHKGGNLL